MTEDRKENPIFQDYIPRKVAKIFYFWKLEIAMDDDDLSRHFR